MSDNHPFLQKALDGAGFTSDDRSAVYRHLELEAALYSPEQRRVVLEAIDREIENDESNRDSTGQPKRPGSLRERAQLLNLRRSLSAADKSLKAAGR